MSKAKNNDILEDLGIVTLSVILALMMVKTQVFSSIISSFAGFESIGSFLAGLFFTSIFTTAPAIVTLGEIAKYGSILNTAFFGAIGAVLGDMVIFSFIRDRLTTHFEELMKHEKWWRRVHTVFKLRYFRWLTFLLGGIIIASPLPDELGISLLGMSKMKTKQFVQISFVFNFIGILVIGYLAKNI